jgi:hypothetical protein
MAPGRHLQNQPRFDALRNGLTEALSPVGRVRGTSATAALRSSFASSAPASEGRYRCVARDGLRAGRSPKLSRFGRARPTHQDGVDRTGVDTGRRAGNSAQLATCDDAEVAYDDGLATRVRDLIGDEPGLVEKKMFGGLAMMIDGNMAVGVHGENLIVRTAPELHEQLLAESGARPFDLTGRQMKGWLLVDPDGNAEDDDLRRWVARGVAFARSLPAK